MRVFAVAADVVMGLVLGTFLYVAISRTWTGLGGAWPAAAILIAAVLAVLLRRPNGSLARQRDRPGR